MAFFCLGLLFSLVDQDIFEFLRSDGGGSQFLLRHYPNNGNILGAVHYSQGTAKRGEESIYALILKVDRGDYYLLVGNSLSHFDRILSSDNYPQLIKKSSNLKADSFDEAYSKAKIQITNLLLQD
jgi:hypothetical protein